MGRPVSIVANVAPRNRRKSYLLESGRVSFATSECVFPIERRISADSQLSAFSLGLGFSRRWLPTLRDGATPYGHQRGDVVALEHRDPIRKDHVQISFGGIRLAGCGSSVSGIGDPCDEKSWRDSHQPIAVATWVPLFEEQGKLY